MQNGDGFDGQRVKIFGAHARIVGVATDWHEVCEVSPAACSLTFETVSPGGPTDLDMHRCIMPAPDPLDSYIDAVSAALRLPIDDAWKPAVRANLEVTLRLARLVDDFALPDEAEPAPVFSA